MRSSAIMKGEILTVWSKQLTEMWSTFNIFLRSLRLVSKKKWIVTFLPVTFSVKIYKNVLLVLDSVSFSDAENSSCKVEAYLFNKVAFVTSKYLIFGRKYLRKMFSKYTAVCETLCAKFFDYLAYTEKYPSKWAISVTEIHFFI